MVSTMYNNNNYCIIIIIIIITIIIVVKISRPCDYTIISVSPMLSVVIVTGLPVQSQP